MLDSGANCSAIIQELAIGIGAEIETFEIKLGTFDRECISEKELASFTITNLSQTFSIDIRQAIVGNSIAAGKEKPPTNESMRKYAHMKGTNFIELKDKTVGVLLDSKFLYTWLTGKVIKGENHEPLLIHTMFGPAIGGQSDNDIVKTDVKTVNCVNLIGKDRLMNLDSNKLALLLKDIDENIQRIYRHDFIMRPGEIFPSEATHMSLNDRLSYEKLKKGILKNDETGHYQVPLPFILGREKTAELFNTLDFFSNAMSRLDKLKRKFERNPSLKDGSFKQVNELIKQNYAVEIKDTTVDSDNPVCYLPNLVVLHPDKPGKFRVCQDAAAQVSGIFEGKLRKHSLNTYLHSGPDNLQKLVGHLLRFRQHQYVIIGDVRDFFYRVEVHPKDRASLRFLWWQDKNMDKVIVLQGSVHLFGLASSPAVSTFTVQHHANIIRPHYDPLVYDTMLHFMYVDDVMRSVDSIETGMMLIEKLTEVFSQAKMVLTKWKSNNKEINEFISSNPNLQASVEAASSENQGNDDKKETSGSSEKPLNDSDEQKREIDEFLDQVEQSGKVNIDSVNDVIERSFNGDNNFQTDLANLTSPNPVDKVLGLGYDLESDTLFVRIGEKHKREVLTKVELLSWISSVFDPIGILGPYVLKGRMFFQAVNQREIDWRDPIPIDILTPFTKWKKSIESLREIKIPRWTSLLGLDDVTTILACFSDASKDGYSASCYIVKRLKGESDRDSHVSFLMGKCHVVPLGMQKKPIDNQECHSGSIPKLELMAAKLAAILRDLVVRESREQFDEICMFSDSITVLHWIQDFERRQKTFINFRINYIRGICRVADWGHVPTDKNPADVGSKGVNGNEIKRLNFYLSGPQFLRKSKDHWPPRMPSNVGTKKYTVQDPSIAAMAISSLDDHDHRDERPEMNVSPIELWAVNATQIRPKGKFTISDGESWPLRIAEKRGLWRSKVRLISMIIIGFRRLAEYIRNKKDNMSLRNKKKVKQDNKRISITKSEYEKAEMLLIKAIQEKHFLKEIMILVDNGVFSPNSDKELKSKSSKLRHLTPFIDDDNVLRAGGRLNHASYMSFDFKFPIILPGEEDHNITSLIEKIHIVDGQHLSKMQTFYLLQNRFHVIGGKSIVDRIIRKCPRCQRLFKNAEVQKMGDIPKQRLDVATPFSSAGLDAFGPYNIKFGGRGSCKRWVLMICCFVTRAVCLITMKDMTMDTVIKSLVKMQALFPSLQRVFSDNGSNFVSADKTLREAVKLWDQQSINDKLSDRQLIWEFGPARCGSAGGTWERVIGLSKKLIKSALGERIVGYDTFDAIVAGTMAIMNNRPLTQAPSAIDEISVLSPAHFLFPYNFINSSLSILPPAADHGRFLRESWRTVQSALDEFWGRWQRTYISTLRNRPKWLDSKEGPKVGQIVILIEDTLPRDKWRLARIVSIINSDNIHTRRIELIDAKGTKFHRHVTGIVPLELE